MFETLKALPELSGFNANLMYARLSACGYSHIAEIAVNDGAVDAYMECAQAGDFTNVVKLACRYSWKRYLRECRIQRRPIVPIINKAELDEGSTGLYLEESEEYSTPSTVTIRVDERGITAPLKDLVKRQGGSVLSGVSAYIKRASEVLGLYKKDHPDYDPSVVLVEFWCGGKTLKELCKTMPSFSSYSSLAHRVWRDMAKIQAWAKTTEGSAVFCELFGYPLDCAC